MALTRKITISSVMGPAGIWFKLLMAEVLKPENKDKNITMPLMRVYGLAQGGKPGASEFGEFVKINGAFEAVNLMTAEIFKSPQVILPNFLGDSLYSALNTPNRQGDVQFAFEIGARYDEKSVTKYVYEIEDLVPASQNDPMAAMRGMLGVSVGSDGKAVLGAPQAPAALTNSSAPADTPAPSPAPATSKRK